MSGRERIAKVLEKRKIDLNEVENRIDIGWDVESQVKDMATWIREAVPHLKARAEELRRLGVGHLYGDLDKLIAQIESGGKS